MADCPGACRDTHAAHLKKKKKMKLASLTQPGIVRYALKSNRGVWDEVKREEIRRGRGLEESNNENQVCLSPSR